MSSLEQEVKYRLTLTQLPEGRNLILLLATLEAQLLQQRTLYLRDVYWDTRDLAWLRRGCALRIRWQQGRPHWTVKCRLSDTERGIQRRREWEHPADPSALVRFLSTPRWHALPEPARRQLPPVQEPLIPVVDAVARRQEWVLTVRTHRLVAHREEVWYGTRREVFFEVEGPRDLLYQLIQRWRLYIGLPPSAETKLARGLVASRENLRE
ncbi:MAG: CYTH domain-containing protein [Candidatus Hydrothermae bacterium]|nr:CYTH domain-containing protein [Candidatus Hydrothermae bacterium]